MSEMMTPIVLDFSAQMIPILSIMTSDTVNSWTDSLSGIDITSSALRFGVKPAGGGRRKELNLAIAPDDIRRTSMQNGLTAASESWIAVKSFHIV